MSDSIVTDPVRIAIVAEGVTDFIVIRAIAEALVGERTVDCVLIQPDESVAFSGAGDAGILGGGWKGVYKWCQQSAKAPGTREVLLSTYDLLVLHLDADVGEDPHEQDWPPGLPCSMPCPPTSDKTDALRAVVLGWLNVDAPLPQMVFCIPSMSTEAWIVWLFFPNDSELRRYRENWECYPNPAGRLAQLPKKLRFRKKEADYRDRSVAIREGWPTVAAALSQARRFEDEFLAALE